MLPHIVMLIPTMNRQVFYCTSCMNTIGANCVKVACSICYELFHFSCSPTGVQDKMRKQFLDLLGQCCWVCDECRSTTRSPIQKLQAEVSHLTDKKDGYRQLNVRQLGSLRPWDHRGKCYMDRKRIQCLSNASQHVPIHLQPFLRYSGISVASDWFSTVLVSE